MATGDVSSNRLARARGVARNAGCDALWIADPPTLRYLTGFTGSSAAFILGPKWACLMTDFRYELQAAGEVYRGIEVLVPKEPVKQALRELLSSVGAASIGYSPESVTVSWREEMRRGLGRKVAMRALTQPLAAIRAVKDAKEIKALEAAVRAAENALRRTLGEVRPGLSEAAIARALGCGLLEEGCEEQSFNMIVASGYRSALPHGAPSTREMAADDILLVDWGARCAGYCSDLTRVYFTGSPDKRLRRIHSVVMEARAAGLAALKPGVAASRVDAAARSVIEKAGYGEYFGHALGHGLGLEVHEAPFIAARSADVLKAGMVFTIEPGIYLPGVGGVRIEDVVHLESAGPRVLSRIARNARLPG
ncbi:MAG: M24 family metallopeptidase [Candidatus Geothermincolia bacterium]